MCILDTAGRCLTRASHKINRKYNTDTTEIIDPILATTFHNMNLSGESEYRRGIPAKPRKCIGKKVKLTPINIVKNWIFNHFGFIVKPLTVNKKTNPNAQINEGERIKRTPWKVPNHLKILIPVGTAIIIVAVVK